MWEPIWASRFRYWLLTGEVSRSCLHSSRTRRVRTLKVTMTVILWVYMFWCTEGCSESRMWSRAWRGVSKLSRHKDWYIGNLCLDIGSVPGEIGIFRSTGRLPEPPGAPVLSETSPKHFRCPNIAVQYINLYVSTISRLLVMSLITSGTPNYLWYIKSHKLIISIVTER